MTRKPIKKKTKKFEHIKCVWGLICSMSAIDQERNNISLFNVVEQLNIPNEVFTKAKNKPFLLRYAHELVVVFRRPLELELCDNKLTADIRISLIDPNGDELNSVLAPMIFEANKKSLKFRAQFNAIKVTHEGEYIYIVEMQQPGDDSFVKVLEVPFLVVESHNS